MALRAVLFDLDDTLTDRNRSIERFALKFEAKFQDALGLLESGQIVRCIVAGDAGGYAPRRDVAAHLCQSLPWKITPNIDQLMRFWQENFACCAVERDGVTETLQWLDRRGLKLGVVTNGTPNQHIKLQVLGIRPLLSAVVVSEEFGRKKPDPAIFQAALDQMGITPAEALFVGDNPELDVVAAEAIGLRAIWLRNNREWPSDMGQLPQSIATLRELPALCDGD